MTSKSPECPRRAPPARGYWYLATPYERYPHDRTTAAAWAVLEAGRLQDAGLLVFSPVAHNHAIVDGYGLPDWRHRLDGFHAALMRPAVGLLVCEVEGWQEGTRDDVAQAEALGKPVIRYQPGGRPEGIEAHDPGWIGWVTVGQLPTLGAD